MSALEHHKKSCLRERERAAIAAAATKIYRPFSSLLGKNVPERTSRSGTWRRDMKVVKHLSAIRPSLHPYIAMDGNHTPIHMAI